MVSEQYPNDNIVTPYDHLIPSVDDPSAQFYLRAIRIYLGLCAGTVGFEDAICLVDSLKTYPEFTKNPTDPTVLPLSETVKARLLDNLQTLKKYNLCDVDSVRSAYSFAFLQDNAPLSESDYSVLQYLIKDPTAPLKKIAAAAGVTPRTAARSIQRLRERNGIRVVSIVDTGVFGLDSFILFFRLQDGVELENIEVGLATFPFTKSMLVNRMTRYGYVGLLFPSSPQNRNVLKASVRELIGTLFAECTIHDQLATGANVSLRLFKDGVWQSPDSLISERSTSCLDEVQLLYPSRHDPSFTRIDYAIASQFRLAVRDSSLTIAQRLRSRGFSVSPERVHQTIRRLKRRRLILPHVLLGGLNLTTNFCFEIRCDQAQHQQVLSLIPSVPSSLYYLSSKGAILWLHLPSTYQVKYLQLFKSLEQTEGIRSVTPILTLTAPGSRSMLDLEKNWKYTPQGWYVEPQRLNLAKWLMQTLSTR